MDITAKKYFNEKETAVYRRDGFILVRRMFGERAIRELSGWIDKLVAKGPESGKEMFYLEDSLLEKGKRVLSRIERFADFNAELSGFIEDERLKGRVRELLGGEPELFKEKVNFKLPGGGGFAPHQDIQPGWDEYAPYFISVLVTIDKSTVENGCLELSPGHHKRGLLGEKWKPLTEEQLQGIDFTAYPMEPGDAAFFDCFVPHQSKPNLTGDPRRNLYLTYNLVKDGRWREKYFSDKRKSYPPDNEREPGKEYTFKV